MTYYLTADDLCFLNELVGGPGGHGADMPGLDAAANRPQAGFGGEQKFPTVWLQAAALLHGLCSTQYFMDGNKRTAWTAADVFLTKNGFTLPRMPAVEAEAFVLAVAKELFTNDDEPERTVEMAAEWFEAKWRSRRVGHAIDPRLEYLYAAKNFVGADDATYSADNIGITAVTSEGYPAELPFGIIGRIHWNSEDAGKPHMLSAKITRADGAEPQFFPDYWEQPFTNEIPPSAHAVQNNTGLLPMIFAIPMQTVITGPGENLITFYIDGEVAGEIPLNVHLVEEVPDIMQIG